MRMLKNEFEYLVQKIEPNIENRVHQRDQYKTGNYNLISDDGTLLQVFNVLIKNATLFNFSYCSRCSLCAVLMEGLKGEIRIR